MPKGAALLEALAALPPRARDAALDTWLHLDGANTHAPLPAGDRVGFHPSGVGAVVQAFLLARLGPQDVLLDVGSGNGKVAMLAELVAGAHALGTELQPQLSAHAEQSTRRLGLTRCRFQCTDVLEQPLPQCTVVYLYVPFTGASLHAFMARLEALARQQDVTVCALGVDLPAREWMKPVASDAFWLNVYQTRVPGAAARQTSSPDWATPAAVRVAEERA